MGARCRGTRDWAYVLLVAALGFVLTGEIALAASDAVPSLPDRRPPPPETVSAQAGKPNDGTPPIPQHKPASKPALPPLPGDQKSVPWTDEQIAAARAACDHALAGLKIEYTQLAPIRKGECGAPAPILVKAIDGIAINPPATMRCPLAAALHRWFTKVVQPEAEVNLGARVVQVHNAASYDCRNRYGKRVGKISQHALANAIDISAYELSTGKEIVQAQSWPKLVPQTGSAIASTSEPKPTANTRVGRLPIAMAGFAPPLPDRNPHLDDPAEDDGNKPEGAASAPRPDPAGQFLVHIHDRACPYFGTVLGPAANAAHAGHFHLDMIKRRKDFCQ